MFLTFGNLQAPVVPRLLLHLRRGLLAPEVGLYGPHARTEPSTALQAPSPR